MNILSACIHVMDLFSTGLLDPASSLALTNVIELLTGIRENLQCSENTFSLLKVPISAVTIKNLLRHYAKRAFETSK